MKSIETLHQRIDEIIVQTELGKRQAVEYVEESKRNLHEHLEKIIHTYSATTAPMKKKMAQLQLQLSLGRMETKDAYIHQRETLEQLIDELDKAMTEGKHNAAEEFHHAAQSLMDRVHMLALSLSNAADDVKTVKKATTDKLSRIKANLDQNSHEVVVETK